MSAKLRVFYVGTDSADPAAIIQALESLGIGASFEFAKVKRRGIGATKFRVAVTETKHHRHLPAILKLIEASGAPPRAKTRAVAAFEHLGKAEAAVHQVPIEKVHFHEVGAADSIADIVGACVALELLHIDEIACSPFNVGSGTVETEHGTLPVPAPATARLLRDKPVYSSGPNVELTTPTGAALACLASHFGPLPPMVLRASGYGAGERDFPQHANVLRVVIGDTLTRTDVREAI